jgi:hypothetical protein
MAEPRDRQTLAKRIEYLISVWEKDNKSATCTPWYYAHRLRWALEREEPYPLAAVWDQPPVRETFPGSTWLGQKLQALRSLWRH